METLQSVAAISAGASCGAVLRWVIGTALNGIISGLPIGTTLVNIIGGFLIGILSPLTVNLTVLRPLLITGFLGGLTTFSTFSLEAASMLRGYKYCMFAAHFLMNAFGSICSALLGIWLYEKLHNTL